MAHSSQRESYFISVELMSLENRLNYIWLVSFANLSSDQKDK